MRRKKKPDFKFLQFSDEVAALVLASSSKEDLALDGDRFFKHV
jgi:hypothetical protein